MAAGAVDRSTPPAAARGARWRAAQCPGAADSTTNPAAAAIASARARQNLMTRFTPRRKSSRVFYPHVRPRLQARALPLPLRFENARGATSTSSSASS